jgi:hypothetical protein
MVAMGWEAMPSHANTIQPAHLPAATTMRVVWRYALAITRTETSCSTCHFVGLRLRAISSEVKAWYVMAGSAVT